MPSNTRIALIVSFSLLALAGSPALAEAPATPAPPPVVQLVGIVPGTGQAILYDASQKRYVVVGVGGEIHGARVVSITEDRIVVTQGRISLAVPLTPSPFSLRKVPGNAASGPPPVIIAPRRYLSPPSFLGDKPAAPAPPSASKGEQLPVPMPADPAPDSGKVVATAPAPMPTVESAPEPETEPEAVAAEPPPLPASPARVDEADSGPRADMPPPLPAERKPAPAIQASQAPAADQPPPLPGESAPGAAGPAHSRGAADDEPSPLPTEPVVVSLDALRAEVSEVMASRASYTATMDRSSGIELRGISSGSLPHQLGLRTGDRLISLDGKSLDDADAAADAYLSLLPGRQFELVVKRRTGRKETLLLRVTG